MQIGQNPSPATAHACRLHLEKSNCRSLVRKHASLHTGLLPTARIVAQFLTLPAWFFQQKSQNYPVNQMFGTAFGLTD
jgi:hypothetical protein